MAVKDPKTIIPNIDLTPGLEDAERRLYENFSTLKDLLSDGVTTTVTVGGISMMFTKGILKKVV